MQLELFQFEPLPRMEHPIMDIDTNEKLVEELAQAIASNDPTAARVAATVLVGKVLNLFERHVVALEYTASHLGQLNEMLDNARHREEYGFFVKPR